MISADIFNEFPLFANLDTSFVEKLAALGNAQKVAGNEWLFHEGESADTLYLILRGSVDLRLKLDDTQKHYATLNTLHHGDALGWSALVDPYVYRLAAQTAEATELVKIDAASLRALVVEQPEQGYLLMQGIAQAMASRVDTLSERLPGLSLRLIIATLLAAIGSIWALLAVAFGLSVAYAVSRGDYSEDFSMLLFCLIVPVLFFAVAWRIYPKNHS